MGGTIQNIDDQTFIREFENQTLNPEYFDHLGHLRIAWLYLSRYSLNEANQRVCNGIKIYAESLGATDKFNLTITDALVKIMAQRMETGQGWEDFIRSNADLVENALSVLGNYYSEEVLFSEEAKRCVLEADVREMG